MGRNKDIAEQIYNFLLGKIDGYDKKNMGCIPASLLLHEDPTLVVNIELYDPYGPLLDPVSITGVGTVYGDIPRALVEYMKRTGVRGASVRVRGFEKGDYHRFQTSGLYCGTYSLLYKLMKSDGERSIESIKKLQEDIFSGVRESGRALGALDNIKMEIYEKMVGFFAARAPDKAKVEVRGAITNTLGALTGAVTTNMVDDYCDFYQEYVSKGSGGERCVLSYPPLEPSGATDYAAKRGAAFAKALRRGITRYDMINTQGGSGKIGDGGVDHFVYIWIELMYEVKDRLGGVSTRSISSQVPVKTPVDFYFRRFSSEYTDGDMPTTATRVKEATMNGKPLVDLVESEEEPDNNGTQKRHDIDVFMEEAPSAPIDAKPEANSLGDTLAGDDQAGGVAADGMELDSYAGGGNHGTSMADYRSESDDDSDGSDYSGRISYDRDTSTRSEAESDENSGSDYSDSGDDDVQGAGGALLGVGELPAPRPVVGIGAFGRGLFAERDYIVKKGKGKKGKGEIVTYYNGEILSFKESQDQNRNPMYMMGVSIGDVGIEKIRSLKKIALDEGEDPVKRAHAATKNKKRSAKEYEPGDIVITPSWEPGYVVDALHGPFEDISLGRYINSSHKDKNVKFISRNGALPYFRVIKNVAKGEEFLTAYQSSYWTRLKKYSNAHADFGTTALDPEDPHLRLVVGRSINVGPDGEILLKKGHHLTATKTKDRAPKGEKKVSARNEKFTKPEEGVRKSTRPTKTNGGFTRKTRAELVKEYNNDPTKSEDGEIMVTLNEMLSVDDAAYVANGNAPLGAFTGVPEIFGQLGVVASKNLAPYIMVATYEGIVLSALEVMRIEEKAKKRPGVDAYMASVGLDEAIDGYKKGGIASCINHYENLDICLNTMRGPNCAITEKVRGSKFLYIASIRPIEVGEQLLVDYGHGYWERVGKNILLSTSRDGISNSEDITLRDVWLRQNLLLDAVTVFGDVEREDMLKVLDVARAVVCTMTVPRAVIARFFCSGAMSNYISAVLSYVYGVVHVRVVDDGTKPNKNTINTRLSAYHTCVSGLGDNEPLTPGKMTNLIAGDREKMGGFIKKARGTLKGLYKNMYPVSYSGEWCKRIASVPKGVSHSVLSRYAKNRTEGKDGDASGLYSKPVVCVFHDVFIREVLSKDEETFSLMSIVKEDGLFAYRMEHEDVYPKEGMEAIPWKNLSISGRRVSVAVVDSSKRPFSSDPRLLEEFAEHHHGPMGAVRGGGSRSLEVVSLSRGAGVYSSALAAGKSFKKGDFVTLLDMYAWEPPFCLGSFATFSAGHNCVVGEKDCMGAIVVVAETDIAPGSFISIGFRYNILRTSCILRSFLNGVDIIEALGKSLRRSVKLKLMLSGRENVPLEGDNIKSATLKDTTDFYQAVSFSRFAPGENSLIVDLNAPSIFLALFCAMMYGCRVVVVKNPVFDEDIVREMMWLKQASKRMDYFSYTNKIKLVSLNKGIEDSINDPSGAAPTCYSLSTAVLDAVKETMGTNITGEFDTTKATHVHIWDSALTTGAIRYTKTTPFTGARWARTHAITANRIVRGASGTHAHGGRTGAAAPPAPASTFVFSHRPVWDSVLDGVRIPSHATTNVMAGSRVVNVYEARHSAVRLPPQGTPALRGDKVLAGRWQDATHMVQEHGAVYADQEKMWQVPVEGSAGREDQTTHMSEALCSGVVGAARLVSSPGPGAVVAVVSPTLAQLFLLLGAIENASRKPSTLVRAVLVFDYRSEGGDNTTEQLVTRFRGHGVGMQIHPTDIFTTLCFTGWPLEKPDVLACFKHGAFYEDTLAADILNAANACFPGIQTVPHDIALRCVPVYTPECEMEGDPLGHILSTASHDRHQGRDHMGLGADVMLDGFSHSPVTEHSFVQVRGGQFYPFTGTKGIDMRSLALCPPAEMWSVRGDIMPGAGRGPGSGAENAAVGKEVVFHVKSGSEMSGLLVFCAIKVAPDDVFFTGDPFRHSVVRREGRSYSFLDGGARPNEISMSSALFIPEKRSSVLDTVAVSTERSFGVEEHGNDVASVMHRFSFSFDGEQATHEFRYIGNWEKKSGA